MSKRNIFIFSILLVAFVVGVAGSLQVFAIVTWEETQPAGDVDRDWMSVDTSQDGSVVVGAVESGRVYLSTDSGSSWSEVQPAGDTDEVWQEVAVSTNGQIIAAVAYLGTAYLSEDGGSTWSQLTPGGFSSDEQWNFVDMSGDGSVIIIGSYGSPNNTAPKGRFYVSTDGGDTWNERQPSISSWRRAAVSRDGSTIYVAEDTQLHRSTDNGVSWTGVRPESLSADALATSQDGSDVIFGGRGDDPIYLSTDSGANWSKIQPAGNVTRNWGNASISDDGQIILVGSKSTDGRLYSSTDGGSSWTEEQPAGDVDRDWIGLVLSGDGSRAYAGVGDSSNGRLYMGPVSTDSTSPTVELTAPSDGATVSGSSVTLTASSSDNIGVAGVKFYVDGVLQGSEDTSSPYSISWDSTASSSADRTVKAVARDSAGNKATSTSATVTVDNMPTSSSFSESVNSTSATITWSTAKAGSTHLYFGVASALASSTAETNTGNNATTSHSGSLSNLVPCATYVYKTVSNGPNNADTATSSEQSFSTTGCSGGASVTSSGKGQVGTSTGGTVVSGDVTLTVPSGYTATSSTSTFQINKLDGSTFFGSVSAPSGKSDAGSKVYNLKALTDATTTLTSFDSAVTVQVSYSDSDVSSLDESTLEIRRYDGSSWNTLTNCSVDTGANTVSCDTTQFSDFAVFGSESSSDDSSSGSISGGIVTFSCKDKSASNYKSYGFHKESLCEYTDEQPTQDSQSKAERIKQLQKQLAELIARYEELTGTVFLKGESSASTPSSDLATVRDLTLGAEGDDVRRLQELLITQNVGPSATELARVGATGYFGPYTQNALGEYQKANSIEPWAGYFGPITREQMANAGLDGLWW